MAKNIFNSDGPKRSIKDVPLPDRQKALEDSHVQEVHEEPREVERMEREIQRDAEAISEEKSFVAINKVERTEPTYSKPIARPQQTDDVRVKFQADPSTYPKPMKSYSLMWTIGAIVLLVLLGLFFFLPTKAEVAINLQEAEIAVNEDISTVPTQDISLDVEVSMPLPEGGAQVDVARKATGIVTLMNTSKEPIQLLIDTRLETKKGLIYKTNKALTIPAATTAGPGSIDVGATATSTGPEYNTTSEEFVIFGFKGTPKGSVTSAKTKTAFTGGFVGKAVELSTDQVAQLKLAAQDLLRKQFTAKLASESADFIAFESSLVIDPTYSQDDKEFKASQEVKATVFGKTELESVLGVPIASLGGATYTKTDDGKFTISGNVMTDKYVDEADLKRALLGVSKDQADIVLAKYPTISEATVSLSPVWRSSLPKDPEAITIIKK